MSVCTIRYPENVTQATTKDCDNSKSALTPKLTPNAYPGCDRSATIGIGSINPTGESLDCKSLPNGEIGTEKVGSSSNDNKNGEGGIRTRGAGLYPHDGLANR